MNPDLFKQRLEAMAARVRDAFGLPGLSVSVTAGGQDYHIACGYADLEAGIPATPQTVYAIGSTTKAFVATLICMLAGAGKLELDKPVKAYLPDFNMYDPYMTEHLTVRDILCHRCGLPRYDLAFFNRPQFTTRDYMSILQYMKPVFEPRTTYSYQNHMFMLATVLAEELYGLPWASLVEQRLMQPLGMTHSYGDGTRAPEGPQKAKPYTAVDGKLVGIPYNYHLCAGGAGTIFSTAEDMLKWLKFRLYGDERIIDQALLNESQSPQMLIPRAEGPFDFPEIDLKSYCLGWTAESYQGIRVLQHSGSIDGFRAMAMFAPGRDFAVTVLTNHGATVAMTALCYMVADAALGLEEMDWCGRYLETFGKLMDAEKQRYAASRAKAEDAGECFAGLEGIAGTYSDRVYGDVVIALEAGKPVLKGFGGSFPMRGGAKDLFVVFFEIIGFSFEVQLVRDAAGAVTGLTMPLEFMRSDAILFEKQ